MEKHPQSKQVVHEPTVEQLIPGRAVNLITPPPTHTPPLYKTLPSPFLDSSFFPFPFAYFSSPPGGIIGLCYHVSVVYSIEPKTWAISEATVTTDQE